MGTTADGAIGPKTLAAMAGYFVRPGAEGIFVDRFCRLQLEHYMAIIAKRPDQAKYINGWKARAAWKPA